MSKCFVSDMAPARVELTAVRVCVCVRACACVCMLACTCASANFRRILPEKGASKDEKGYGDAESEIKGTKFY